MKLFQNRLSFLNDFYVINQQKRHIPMRILIVGLSTAVVLTLCSFVIHSTQQKLPVDQKLYKEFLAKFDKVKMPYNISYEQPKTRGDMYETKFKTSHENTRGNKHLSHDFSKFIPAIRRGYMSRMGPDDYQAEVLVAATEQFNAIIYSKRPSHAGRKTAYILMTFDQYGDLISKEEVANIYGSNSFTEAKISKNLVVTTKEYKAIYDKDAEYSEDQKVDFELQQIAKYTIAATGEILKDGESAIKAKQELEPIQQKTIEIGMSEEEADLWDF